MDPCVTLWQFLLQLFRERGNGHIISWTSRDGGELKLVDAEGVARLWGLRKNKTNVNCDKPSRAVRYYCDKNITRKVSGQKFVYKFVSYPEVVGCSTEDCTPRGAGVAGPGGLACSSRNDYMRSGLYSTFPIQPLQPHWGGGFVLEAVKAEPFEPKAEPEAPPAEGVPARLPAVVMETAVPVGFPATYAHVDPGAVDAQLSAPQYSLLEHPEPHCTPYVARPSSPSSFRPVAAPRCTSLPSAWMASQPPWCSPQGPRSHDYHHHHPHPFLGSLHPCPELLSSQPSQGETQFS
uniref:ETS domain-containing protein n=1 Tax=Monodon monoceros TaxID=40151 RepID=A0A8C6AYP0_MONMO